MVGYIIARVWKNLKHDVEKDEDEKVSTKYLPDT
jgi:hypothetical protein